MRSLRGPCEFRSRSRPLPAAENAERSGQVHETCLGEFKRFPCVMSVLRPAGPAEYSLADASGLPFLFEQELSGLAARRRGTQKIRNTKLEIRNTELGHNHGGQYTDVQLYCQR
jgi:hypothetical protein